MRYTMLALLGLSLAHCGEAASTSDVEDHVNRLSDASEESEGAPLVAEPADNDGDEAALPQDGASAALEQARAAPPCSDELDFVGAHVSPDLGALGAPGSKRGRDPAKLGPYRVAAFDVRVPVAATRLEVVGYDIQIADGLLEGTVYAPSHDGKTMATDARFPLLVGGAGFLASYRDYAGYWKHFASHGVVVLGLTTRGDTVKVLHDKEALETSLAITWLTEESPYAAQLDADKIATAGHSKGGKVAFFTAAIDPRVDIVFGWDPSNAGGPPCQIAQALHMPCHLEPVAPNCAAVAAGIKQPEGILEWLQAESFVFGVPPDPLFNPEPSHNALNFYRGAPSPASLVYFDGGHPAWIDSGLPAALGNRDIIRITKTVQTAKLLSFFFGEPGLERYLPAAGSALSRERKVTMLRTK